MMCRARAGHGDALRVLSRRRLDDMPRIPTPRPFVAVAAAGAALALLPAVPAAGQARDGTIVRVAGSTPGFAGDGGPASAAQLNAPADVAFAGPTSFAIADTGNDRIRQVRPDGTIVTVAGSTRGFSGDGGPATSAQLDRPAGLAVQADGSLLVADTFNQRIRRVGQDGDIETVAGTGARGSRGDGGPAVAAELQQPGGIAVLPGGGYVVADTANHRIRRIGPDGVITTIAGTTRGFSGDGGPARSAQLDQPSDVAVDGDGSILVADTGNHRVRRIAPDGTIVTLAGRGPGLSGDGDPGRFARVTGPVSVAPLTNGGVLLSDTGNHRVRRVTPLGTIFTVAGTSAGNAGDGGQARTAQLRSPGGLAIAPGGGFLVVDTANATVRRVSDFGAVPPAVLARSVGVSPAGGAVTVRPPGTPQFLALREEDLVPMTSVVDASRGQVQLATAVNTFGAQQVARAFDGAFTVRQAGIALPFTTLRLPSLTGCPGAAASRSARMTLQAGQRQGQRRKRRRRRRGPSRALWVSDTGGRWRTATGSVSATAIGTRWRTTLQCDGVRVTVREGRVRVRDRLRRRSVVLRPGQTRFVRTPGRNRGR
jgi:sugar lactone lactonase YvrE